MCVHIIIINMMVSLNLVGPEYCEQMRVEYNAVLVNSTINNMYGKYATQTKWMRNLFLSLKSFIWCISKINTQLKLTIF